MHSTSSSCSTSTSRQTSAVGCSSGQRRRSHRAGTFVFVGHDLTNLIDGVGGPSDPRILCTPEEIAAELPGLEIEKAERVLREVDGEERDAIDALVRARRLSPS